LNEFPKTNWIGHAEDLSILDWLVAKIDKYVTAGRVAVSGQPRTACTADNVVTVEELVQSQAYRLQTRRAVRETTRKFQRTSNNQIGSCSETHEKEASARPHRCEQEGKNGVWKEATEALAEPYGKIHMVQ